MLASILTTFKQMFFDPQENLIAEWSPWGGDDTIYEPGHSFEWCCLLAEAAEASIDVSVLDVAQAMCAAAENKGVCSDSKTVWQSISSLEDKDRFRIWPTLERLR